MTPIPDGRRGVEFDCLLSVVNNSSIVSLNSHVVEIIVYFCTKERTFLYVESFVCNIVVNRL